jgi:hypothetical protein
MYRILLLRGCLVKGFMTRKAKKSGRKKKGG